MAHSPFSLARSLLLAFAVGSTVTLAGCGAVIVGGAAATTAMVVPQANKWKTRLSNSKPPVK
jgi:uncharacterized protein YceK